MITPLLVCHPNTRGTRNDSYGNSVTFSPKANLYNNNNRPSGDRASSSNANNSWKTNNWSGNWGDRDRRN